MKILLINHYAGSINHGMEFRPYYMSREWVKMGHDVTIVAASFSHLRQKNIDMEEPIKEEYIDGIRYVWLKTPVYHGNGIGRIKNMLSFLRKLYKFEKVINKDLDPDVVIASSTYPLDSYPANWIAKKHKAKFVFELHDLWPMSPMVLGNMSQWHPFIMVMQRAEDYWCKNADLVISLHPYAYKHLITRGMSIDNYRVVTNGIVIEEWDENYHNLPEPHNTTIINLKNQDKFLLGYAGGHALSNGLDLLVNLANSVKIDKSIHFVFVGDGVEKQNLEKMSSSLQLTNISFLPPIPKNTIKTFYTAMDVLTCCLPMTPLLQYGPVMNKTFEYMMAGKPALCSCSSTFDPVSESGCGFTVPSGDVETMSQKLFKLKAMDKKSREDMGAKGRAFAVKNYTYSALACKFIEYIADKY